ncbi:hypothetical protein EXIGLDRAFT_772074 [Exidia glandulosa HHB12029]|uniref:Uncharacterized protein n=1 Tax=Exidia glandulosa HHB12029 TaxID=1314781 RepID=A0A165FIR1_EXIGL|nr:hypothetical protein EXIGLDRAFT_772074 [Exidia glandulosa HHB12029]
MSSSQVNSASVTAAATRALSNYVRMLREHLDWYSHNKSTGSSLTMATDAKELILHLLRLVRVGALTESDYDAFLRTDKEGVSDRKWRDARSPSGHVQPTMSAKVKAVSVAAATLGMCRPDASAITTHNNLREAAKSLLKLAEDVEVQTIKRHFQGLNVNVNELASEASTRATDGNEASDADQRLEDSATEEERKIAAEVRQCRELDARLSSIALRARY